MKLSSMLDSIVNNSSEYLLSRQIIAGQDTITFKVPLNPHEQPKHFNVSILNPQPDIIYPCVQIKLQELVIEVTNQIRRNMYNKMPLGIKESPLRQQTEIDTMQLVKLLRYIIRMHPKMESVYMCHKEFNMTSKIMTESLSTILKDINEFKYY